MQRIVLRQTYARIKLIEKMSEEQTLISFMR